MEKKSKYVTVLDFEIGRIFQYRSENFENSDDYEELITNNDHNLSNCSWMVHDDPEIITN